jgi:hypothetical protein
MDYGRGRENAPPACDSRLATQNGRRTEAALLGDRNKDHQTV